MTQRKSFSNVPLRSRGPSLSQSTSSPVRKARTASSESSTATSVYNSSGEKNDGNSSIKNSPHDFNTSSHSNSNIHIHYVHHINSSASSLTTITDRNKLEEGIITRRPSSVIERHLEDDLVVGIRRQNRRSVNSFFGGGGGRLSFFFRWISYLVAIAVIHILWNSIQLTRRQMVNESMEGRNVGFFIPPQQTSGSDLYPSAEQRKMKRSRRKRPPTHSNPLATTTKAIDSAPHLEYVGAKATKIKVLPDHFPTDDKSWRDLCGKREYNEKGNKSRKNRKDTEASVAVIYGILSHPLGSEVALALGNHCGMDTVIGISDHELDIEASMSLEFLLKTMPEHMFRMYRTKPSAVGYELEKIFSFYHPQMVIYLEPLTFLPSHILTAVPAIAVRSSINSLQSVCDTIVEQQKREQDEGHDVGDHNQSDIDKVRFLYVAASPRDRDVLISRSMVDVHPMLLKTYTAHYGMTVSQLRLPTIYGPFRDGSSWLHHKNDVHSSEESSYNKNSTNAEGNQQQKHQNHKNNHNQPVIHIVDAVHAVLSAVSHKPGTTSNPMPSEATYLSTQYLPPKSRVTSQESISTAFSTVIATTNNNDDNTAAFNTTNPFLKVQQHGERLSHLMSWSHKYAFPYEDTSVRGETNGRLFRKALAVTNKRLTKSISDKKRNKENKSNNKHQVDSVSQLQRRQDNLFPCISECSHQINCQENSVFTEVIPIVQNMTQSCKYVLYTVDFSLQLSSLPIVEESKSERSAAWPRDTLCQVAFVSKKSKLTKQLVHDEKKKREQEQREDPEHTKSSSHGRRLHTADLNGQIRHNEWSMIWVDGDAESLSERDYILPKISPGNFFGANTTKAFYLEPKHLDRIPPLQVIWFLMSKQLDKKRFKGGRVKLVDNGSTSTSSNAMYATLPPSPAQHIALFTHSYGIPDAAVKESNMDLLARVVLEQKGYGTERASSWPRRQLEYYQHVLEDYEVTLADTFLLIHNLQSERSRRVRCSWYEEQLVWSGDTGRKQDQVDEGQHGTGYSLHQNRDMEDISLAVVMARWRYENRLVPATDELWGERIVDTAKGDTIEIADDDLAATPSQYFIKLHKPMRGRKVYPSSLYAG